MAFTRKYDWDTIDARLIELYRRGEVGSLARLSGEVGVPLHRLSGRAAKLRSEGKLQGYIRRRWTTETEAELIELYPQHSMSALARRFNCTERNLRFRAYRAGASRELETYCATDVATAIGCAVSTACEWCRTGLIKAQRIDGRWLVTEKALRNFLRAHPDRWQRFSCPGRAWIEGILTDYKPPIKTDPVQRRIKLNHDAATYEGRSFRRRLYE